MKPLCLISPWFGPWPVWIEFFVESCKWNAEIEWLIPTDQPPPLNEAPNVRYQRSSFDDYKRRAGSALGVDLTAIDPYKLCDLKPFLGLVHEADLEGFSSFGYCDIDVIFGDLRAVYTDELLASSEAISSAGDRQAGHLSVFSNTRRMRGFCRSIRRWRSLIATPEYTGFDEGAFSVRVRPDRRRWLRRLRAPTSLFVERYTTPGAQARWDDGGSPPTEWLWKRGRLAHERGGEHSIYLHLMKWHSNRWRRSDEGPAPWRELESIVQCDWREAAERGFSISPKGIRAIA